MIDRRSLLAAVMIAPLPLGGLARGQAWQPDRVLRIIVPFAAGSFTDVAARLLATELSAQLGQSVIVENRGGGGSVTGTATVVNAPPDGYTLLLCDTSLSTSPALYPKLPYDPMRDLSQISEVAVSPAILLVRNGLGVRTLAELIALCRQKPGQINFGSGGVGSSAHLGMELLLDAAGIKAQHIPFRGVAAAIAEVMADRVDMAIASLASGVAQVNGGSLLGLAVSGGERSPLLPQVPTFAEAGLPEYRMMYWFGLAAPAGTPADAIARLNHEVAVACAQPRLRDAFARQAAAAAASTPDEMRQLLEREIALWRGVVARARISLQ